MKRAWPPCVRHVTYRLPRRPTCLGLQHTLAERLTAIQPSITFQRRKFLLGSMRFVLALRFEMSMNLYTRATAHC